MPQDDIHSELLKCNCTHKPRFFISNSITGEVFFPDCNAYRCEYCGKRKVRALANGIAAYFENRRVRLATFTTTDRYNAGLEKPLPVLAWRILLRNLRNTCAFRQYRQLQFVRVTEYQENGNPHYHCLFDTYVPFRLMDSLWRDACIAALAENGITVAPEQKISNCNLVGDFSNQKAVFRYVRKYLMKGVTAFAETAKPGERYRPYSTTRGIKIFPTRVKTPGWKITRYSELWGLGLYLSDSGLLPKLIGEDWKLCLSDELYSVIHGEEFDYG